MNSQLHVCSHKRQRERQRQIRERERREKERDRERGGEGFYVLDTDKFTIVIAQLFSLCQ